VILRAVEVVTQVAEVEVVKDQPAVATRNVELARLLKVGNTQIKRYSVNDRNHLPELVAVLKGTYEEVDA